MPRPASSFLAPALALFLAAGLFIQMRSYGAQEDTTDFHAAVRAAVDRLPSRIGDFEGVTCTLPPAAGKLLHPNAAVNYRYKDPTGRWVSVVFVHCRDTRDMSGHYPPNCYGGNGWTQKGPPIEHVFTLWGRRVPVAEYEFSRTEYEHPMHWRIYDFFVLPAGGFVDSMAQIRAASGDYRSRPYGAAQIQVIFDASVPEEERLETLRTMLAPYGPVIDRLQLKKEGA